MAFGYADILAGPIVRRVERSGVAVWLALRKPANVVLSIYDGIKEGNTQDAPVAAAARNTLPVGAELHIAVVALRLADTSPLFSDRIYSYDLGLRDFGSTGGPAPGLLALGLLDEGPVDGRARLPLGNAPGRLPAFMRPYPFS